MSENDFKCLMVGLPRTGKTTYLAALWHVVRSDEVSGSMSLVRREGSQAYLNQIASQWSKCKELDRTPGEGESGIALQLSHPSLGTGIRLEIPDTSGEMYQSHWEFRHCSEAFAKLARNSDGCLLFIHPEKLVEPSFLVDANAIYDEWTADDSAVETVMYSEEDAASPETKDSLGETEWEAKNAPTQVQLIEILQDLVDLSKRRQRVAIIISAWDIAERLANSPDVWFRERVPMLWQYLESNSEQFSYDIFGVSAQGGKVDEAEKLLEFHTASDRITVKHRTYFGHDITMPILWLASPPNDNESVAK
jgi:GTPase SAR1 family protein